jgi:hypothetical protein
MRGVRLYGWQRIGIILSVIWLVIGTGWACALVALLTGPAYAADKLGFVCSGKFSPLNSSQAAEILSYETLLIDLEGKTVSGFIGKFTIDEITDYQIKFSAPTTQSGVSAKGTFDRYSGKVVVVTFGTYELFCRPARLLF